MSAPDDDDLVPPPRLFGSGDTPEALRDALRAARADGPSPDALAALAARLGPLLPPAAPLPGAVIEPSSVPPPPAP